MPRFDTYIYHLKTGGTIEVYLRMLKYNNNRIKIELVDVEDDIPFITATVNIPDEYLEPGEVIIKDSDENQGVLQFLIHHNIVTEPKRYTKVPHVQCAICELLV